MLGGDLEKYHFDHYILVVINSIYFFQLASNLVFTVKSYIITYFLSFSYTFLATNQPINLASGNQSTCN